MEAFIGDSQWIIIPLVLWSVIWKGIALWHSARRGQKAWFIALLVVNMLGILEIIYILLFIKRAPEEELA